MTARRVRLDVCGHYIYTTGDRIQPVKVGALRWCGECHRWRPIIATGDDQP